MAESLANNGMRLRWELVPNDWPQEIAVFSMYTGIREAAQWEALAQEMEDFVVGISGTAGGIINGFTADSRLYVDEYQNPIFSDDDWGNVYQRYVTAAVADGAEQYPLQVALVVSRETEDQELPVKRRKNRSYLGPISTTFSDNDGRLSISGQTALLTKVQTFHTSLQGVALKPGVNSTFAGLCNVSYKGTGILSDAQIASSDRVRVGRVYDTQRSRRNAQDEGYVSVPLS